MLRILVVEDSADKVRRIYRCLSSVPGLSLRGVENCIDAAEAKRRLMQRKYDLPVIDIAIPPQPDGDVRKDGGIELLEEIDDGQAYIVPDHIIGLTAYDELQVTAQASFASKNWIVLKYAGDSEEWEQQLRRKAEHIIAAQRGRAVVEEEYQTDLAIICALNSPELESVRRLGWAWTRIELANDHIPYYRGEYVRSGEGRVVHAAAAPRMGMTAAAVLATKMILAFRPRYLAMSGIAAGIRGRVGLGDVVVVDTAFDYGSGKFQGTGGRSRFLQEPHHLQLAAELRSKAKLLSEDGHWLSDIRRGWPAPAPDTELRIHLGPLASGAAVLADSKVSERLLSLHRKLLGIDMETYGVFCAASEASVPRPQPLVIKGICDFADEEKGDDLQRYAAYTSACVLARFAEEWL